MALTPHIMIVRKVFHPTLKPGDRADHKLAWMTRLRISIYPCPLLRFDRTEGLDRQEWAATVLMGAAVLPLGVVMRFLPPSVEGDRNFAGYKPR